VTSAAVTVDVHASFMDHTLATDNFEGGLQNTAITTATTTDIVAAPGAGVTRNIKALYIRNKHASTAVDVTVVFDANGTDYELYKTTMLAGEELHYLDGAGFVLHKTAAASVVSTNANTADVVASAADTYLTGSMLDLTDHIQIGTIFIFRFVATKTGAGIATPIWSVRVGTAGTVSDTSRLSFTGLAQTGVGDSMIAKIRVIVRGPITASCVWNGSYMLTHNLSATGFCNQFVNVIQSTPAAFDVLAAGLKVGVSCNPGSAGVWTFQHVSVIGANMK
jgi:hypothetical protein